MLSNISATYGKNLAEHFVSKNIQLVPKQATLLQELCSAIHNNMFKPSYQEGCPVMDQNSYNEQIPLMVTQCSAGATIETKGIKSYSESDHDTFMDQYIETLSTIVSNHVAFTRNVVNKDITKLREKLQETFTQYKPKEAEDFFEVCYYQLSDIFKSSLMDNEVKVYADSSKKYYDEVVKLSNIAFTSFDLLGYILTGDEELDGFIRAWFAQMTPDKATYYILNKINEFTLPLTEALDYSLVNFLFYRNLMNKGDLNLGYSSIDLKSVSMTNMDFYGRMVHTLLEQYHRELRNGNLIASTGNLSFSFFNKDALKIVIYEDTFNQFVEKEGNIEVIFGYISKFSNRDLTVEKAVKDKTSLLSSWNAVRSVYTIEMSSKRIDTFKFMLRQAFESIYKESLEQIEEEQFKSELFITETNKLVNSYIDSLELSDIDCLDKVLLNIVAKIQYRYTNAFEILNEMDEILKVSENITPMEASLFSVIKYLTNYLLEQLETGKM